MPGCSVTVQKSWFRAVVTKCGGPRATFGPRTNFIRPADKENNLWKQIAKYFCVIMFYVKNIFSAISMAPEKF